MSVCGLRLEGAAHEPLCGAMDMFQFKYESGCSNAHII